MVYLLRVETIDDVGVSEEFLTQQNSMGKAEDWIAFRDGFCLPGTKLGRESRQGLGRLFCQLNSVAVISGSEVWLARIPKRSGFVARYIDLQVILNSLNVEDEWNKYFLGSAYCLLDPDGGVESSNLAIFWGDVRRFFEQRNLACKPLLNPHQTASDFLDSVAANVSLSGFYVSDEMLELATLSANGVLTSKDALIRLGVISDESSD